jgi:methionyl-tRNA synthetase
MKHSREIQSLLGNYFLRVTSSKLFKGAVGAGEKSIKEIYEHYRKKGDRMSKSLVHLIDTQRTTPAQVKHQMEQLEVAEALRSLVTLLQAVRLIYRF